jgi:CheY-like chemotaxis protein
VVKSCLFVNSDPVEQSTFIEALGDVSPEAFCMMASDDAEALDIMKAGSLVPDFIIIDLEMPGIDAKRFLHHVKNVESLRDVPVIVHCQHPNAYAVMELKEMGAFAIYYRPYDYWGICNILNLYLNDDVKALMN